MAKKILMYQNKQFTYKKRENVCSRPNFPSTPKIPSTVKSSKERRTDRCPACSVQYQLIKSKLYNMVSSIRAHVMK